jgi:putative acetyltransferase
MLRGYVISTPRRLKAGTPNQPAAGNAGKIRQRSTASVLTAGNSAEFPVRLKLMDIDIRIDDLSGPEIAGLLTEHLQSLAKISPPESMHALNLDGLRRPDVTFWSAWQGQELVGCGALKELNSGHGEVKSMRTAAAHLRKGVAATVLKHIITEAKLRGYRKLSLETGATEEHFTPAHQLYHKFGFRKCAPFADYADDPNSLFMTMAL